MTNLPNLGDIRLSPVRVEEMCIEVDGVPSWREMVWETCDDPFRSRVGIDLDPYRVAVPILLENEVLKETIDGSMWIVTFPSKSS